MSNPYAALPGFREFYPDDLAIRRHIFDTWRRVVERYGFAEFDGPPLEPLALYADKSGPEILEQLYHFVDKGEREVALRPEMTPTFARMVGARAGALRKPIKWYSVPQLFRYERQQRGRLREHFQLNVDIVGEESIAGDAELLAVAIDVLRAFGLGPEDFVARVSDRGLLRALLAHLGVDAVDLPAVYAIVDKLERLTPDEIMARLTSETSVSGEVAREVLELFDERDWSSVRERFGSTGTVAPRIEEMEALFRRMEWLGLEEFVRFDLTIVRGLAYYTGPVWELFDVRGELRAIAGGGRYDDLLTRVAGVDLPALGFGMGDVVLRELLADRDLLPSTDRSIDAYLVAVTDEEVPTVLRLARRLRDAGGSVEYALRSRGVGKQFKDASAAGARRVIVVGPDEVARQSVMVRDMATGEESRVAMSELRFEAE